MHRGQPSNNISTKLSSTRSKGQASLLTPAFWVYRKAHPIRSVFILPFIAVLNGDRLDYSTFSGGPLIERDWHVLALLLELNGLMPSPEVNNNVAGGAGAASASNSTPAPPPLGTLIDDGTNAGALQLAAVLGYGGYGVVYRAVSPSGGLYAVKCLLRTSNPNNPKQAQRQRRLHMREIALHRLAGAGAHPGIVRLHRIIEPALPAEDGTLSLPSPYTFLVMDYAPCGDLFTLILHKQVFLGRTSLVGSVFAQLAAAVSHCHSLGIFHRDLKPENVLCWDGGATVRLADFGLATTERRSKEWRTGSVYHMSPECQNGNAATPPYSPLANDIWSLAILLLNLLTARNPWARASPGDPTFSAYLASPRNFLPQVLPISSGLNDVLVRALDVRWERRETFGVDGLAEGVARLVADVEESESRSRRSFATFGKQRSGLYAPDVVFEGGMARCPWEVGMHIPSGSSDSGASNQIPIPQELIEDVPAEPPVARKRSRSSSASYEHSAPQSPSPSFMVETSDVPPSTPAKEEPSVEVQSAVYSKHSPSIGSTRLTSRWSVNSSTSPQDSSVSEIRFANPSDAEVASSSSESSNSSSGVSSVGSEYSATRTPGVSHIAPEPHVSDADLTLAEEAEGYAYVYAASPDTPITVEPEQEPKSPYSDAYAQQSYTPSRRSRYRGRSRGRQPYPQLTVRAHRDGASRRTRFQPRRRKPELRVNVDLPALMPLHVNSSEANGSATARTHTRSRSSTHSVLAVRERAQEHSVESCPFAYSVSRSGSFMPGPEMEIDGDHQRISDSRYPAHHDNDVHMISPSNIPDEEEYAILDSEDAQRYSKVGHTDSFHTSFDGFSLSPSPVSRTSPARATENARDDTFRVSSSGRTLISPISANMEGLVTIDRSTYSNTSPTDVASPTSAYPEDGMSRASQRQSNYAYGFLRSTSPSASSSLYRAGLPSKVNNAFKDMLGEFMDTDELGADFADGLGKQLNVSVESSGDSWVDDLRRVVDEENRHTGMLTDDEDDLPGLPGSFPASPVSVKVPRQSTEMEQSEMLPAARSDSGVQGLGLDLFSSPLENPQNTTRDECGPSTKRYSVPPPSIRSRTNSADEALRALHAIAIGSPAPWKSIASSQSSSSESTHDGQTFMAITTDVSPSVPTAADVRAAANATTEDFQEYMPYLRFVDASVTGSTKVTPAASIHSFRTERVSEYVAISGPSSPDTSPLQRRQTPDCPAQRPQDSISSRRRSRPRSLLKFVSRRPFSSSGSGFLPIPSSKAPTTATPDTETGLSFSAAGPARLSTTYTGKDVRRFSASFSDGQYDKTVPSEASIQSNTRPRSASYPHPKHHRKSQVIESPESSKPLTKTFSRRPSASASKSRTWSFTRSRSQSRRRSRSVSPPPTKGSPRDVLFRLRSARNWFWYALSSVTSRSASAEKKGAFSKWTSTTFVAVAA
ncbi:Pkinase-domain-containing protein [Sanghuangporus baumii]|uniref:Pkinase-domain-containing protein n=1 Tax=Sanghuangporus baumii TaxID=108892 RepID=A0A9Q5HUQ6_SANBA|nr:Pkinase-domain-containing protein [Sanghuangporus baumii]